MRSGSTPLKWLKQGTPKKGGMALLHRGSASTLSPAAIIAEPAARLFAPEEVTKLVPRKLGGAALLSRKRSYIAADE